MPPCYPVTEFQKLVEKIFEQFMSYSAYNPYAFWSGQTSRNVAKGVYNRFAKKVARNVVREGRKGPIATPYKNYLRIKKLKNKPEFKFIDTNGSGNIPDTAVFHCLTSIAQGDTEQARDGEMVTVRSASWKMTLSAPTAYDSTPLWVRVIMFIDHYGRTTPTLNTVQDTDLITSAGSAIIQHFNQDNRGRYRVLFDKHYSLANNSTTTGNIDFDAPFQLFDKYYKKFNFKCHYDGTTATSYSKNQIWLCIFSNKTTDNFPQYDLDTRVYFQE